MKKEEKEIKKSNTSKEKTNQPAKKSTTTKKTTPKQSSKKTVKAKTEKEEIVKKGKKIEKVEETEQVEEIVDVEDLEKEVTEMEPEEEKSTSKKTIKKSDLFLILGLVVVVIVGCFMLKGQKEEPSYKLPLTLTGEAGLHLLSYSEYQEKIDNNESFVVILSRESCSHCANFLPVAEQFANDNALPIYYVDTDTFTEEDWNAFEKSNTYLKRNSGNWGTPTTVVLAGKESVDYIEGETTADNLKNLYTQYFNVAE